MRTLPALRADTSRMTAVKADSAGEWLMAFTAFLRCYLVSRHFVVTSHPASDGHSSVILVCPAREAVVDHIASAR